MIQELANEIKMSFDQIRAVLNEFRGNWFLAKGSWRKDELYQWVNNWMDRFLLQADAEDKLNVIQQLAEDLEGCLEYERSQHAAWQSTCQEKSTFVTAYMSNEIIRVLVLVNDIYSHYRDHAMEDVDTSEQPVQAANLSIYEQRMSR